MAPTPNLDESLAWLTLLRAPGIGAAALRELVARHGSAAAALARAAREEPLPAGARAALREPDAAARDVDTAWLRQPGHHLLAWTSADYPPLLRDVAGAPAGVFVAGDHTLSWM
jgi:DNA processing protein